MAKKPRAQLTERKLRETKDNLLRRITDQQKALGCPVPDPGAAEAFIDPILRKVEIKHEEDRIKELLRESIPEPEATEIVERHDAETGFFKQASGTYDWHLGTDQVTAHPGSWEPTREDYTREIVRRLNRIPEWKAQFTAASSICETHQLVPEKYCVACDRREQRMWDVLALAYKKFGDPHKKKDRRIQVG